MKFYRIKISLILICILAIHSPAKIKQIKLFSMAKTEDCKLTKKGPFADLPWPVAKTISSQLDTNLKSFLGIYMESSDRKFSPKPDAWESTAMGEIGRSQNSTAFAYLEIRPKEDGFAIIADRVGFSYGGESGDIHSSLDRMVASNVKIINGIFNIDFIPVISGSEPSSEWPGLGENNNCDAIDYVGKKMPVQVAYTMDSTGREVRVEMGYNSDLTDQDLWEHCSIKFEKEITFKHPITNKSMKDNILTMSCTRKEEGWGRLKYTRRLVKIK